MRGALTCECHAGKKVTQFACARIGAHHNARMDLLIETIAALPPDAWEAVRARLPAGGRLTKPHAFARAWLTYHALCMERYAAGADLPALWPVPTPQLMTLACDHMPRSGLAAREPAEGGRRDAGAGLHRIARGAPAGTPTGDGANA